MPKNTLTTAQDRFWYARGVEFNGTDWQQQRELSNLAFAAGARWNMRETSILSPHIAKFIEMLILLGIADDAEDTALETERHSPLWRTAGAGTPGDQTEPPY